MCQHVVGLCYDLDKTLTGQTNQRYLQCDVLGDQTQTDVLRSRVILTGSAHRKTKLLTQEHSYQTIQNKQK